MLHSMGPEIKLKAWNNLVNMPTVYACLVVLIFSVVMDRNKPISAPQN